MQDEEAPGSGGSEARGRRGASAVDFDTMTEQEVRDLVADALDHLSVEGLSRVIQVASERRRARQDEAKETLLQEFQQRAADMGLSLDTLFPSGAGRRRRSDAGQPLPVKFRGPNGEEWSGRGHPPKWLVALESDGRNREEFRV